MQRVFNIEAVIWNPEDEAASGALAVGSRRAPLKGEKSSGRNYETKNPQAGFSSRSNRARNASAIFVLDVADRVDL